MKLTETLKLKHFLGPFFIIYYFTGINLSTLHVYTYNM